MAKDPNYQAELENLQTNNTETEEEEALADNRQRAKSYARDERRERDELRQRQRLRREQALQDELRRIGTPNSSSPADREVRAPPLNTTTNVNPPSTPRSTLRTPSVDSAPNVNRRLAFRDDPNSTDVRSSVNPAPPLNSADTMFTPRTIGTENSNVVIGYQPKV
jgi:hypothetical protein